MFNRPGGSAISIAQKFAIGSRSRRQSCAIDAEARMNRVYPVDDVLRDGKDWKSFSSSWAKDLSKGNLVNPPDPTPEQLRKRLEVLVSNKQTRPSVTLGQRRRRITSHVNSCYNALVPGRKAAKTAVFDDTSPSPPGIATPDSRLLDAGKIEKDPLSLYDPHLKARSDSRNPGERPPPDPGIPDWLKQIRAPGGIPVIDGTIQSERDANASSFGRPSEEFSVLSGKKYHVRRPKACVILSAELPPERDLTDLLITPLQSFHPQGLDEPGNASAVDFESHNYLLADFGVAYDLGASALACTSDLSPADSIMACSAGMYPISKFGRIDDLRREITACSRLVRLIDSYKENECWHELDDVRKIPGWTQSVVVADLPADFRLGVFAAFTRHKDREGFSYQLYCGYQGFTIPQIRVVQKADARNKELMRFFDHI